ncbi:hypothetical protein LX15_004886 [Streptoalloteichus tenebrarius]|uniref:PE domain-containing protein n=1 Tax=Streptoalloteichus tenebrarius (strain ATCC 17920 / DSM 40477 / JCM 4838 / CBS 697.72 / NBRC 16177 / NCIMB 11028 / NRRL B-12390 / A12253. 1 / ISP 5477) TaxID=1933 RepID=A0ABT1I091_STRSD|nr:hypothetical protein [Streptoalloteichus tenebrarius]MCP2261165.1 hypothetical protein [Streptoalloteichus tenebrarius]
MAGVESCDGVVSGAWAPRERIVGVRRDNVLQARAVLVREARELRALLTSVASDLTAPPLAEDPVSSDAARVLAHRLRDGEDSYFARWWQYTENLLATAADLAAAARRYGYSEDEITSSSGRGADHGQDGDAAPSSPGASVPE